MSRIYIPVDMQRMIFELQNSIQNTPREQGTEKVFSKGRFALKVTSLDWYGLITKKNSFYLCYVFLLLILVPNESLQLRVACWSSRMNHCLGIVNKKHLLNFVPLNKNNRLWNLCYFTNNVHQCLCTCH